MREKKTVEDIDVAGKTVLLRVDFNVPFHPGTTQISDDSRIKASLPTLGYLIERECKVIACSHLGRPRGKTVEDLRMAPVSRCLSDLFSHPVIQAADSVGPEVNKQVEALPAGGVMMLENLRFHPGEERNEPEFAAALASLADIYVNDAFGAAHRAHASTEGVCRYLPSVAGLLIADELRMLGRALHSPQRPFTAVLGGAKVSDKVAVIENLVDRVDILVIGGGMGATFLKAKGLQVGESLVEGDWVQFVEEFTQTAGEKGVDLLLPIDVVVSDAFSADSDHRVVDVDSIPPMWRIMDIGPNTTSSFEEALSGSKTVVWNGPMGVFEWEPFAEGTRRIARAMAGIEKATTVVGGGSTAEAVIGMGLASKMTHVSTGGGASLQFMEGKDLPGVVALMDKD